MCHSPLPISLAPELPMRSAAHPRICTPHCALRSPPLHRVSLDSDFVLHPDLVPILIRCTHIQYLLLVFLVTSAVVSFVTPDHDSPNYIHTIPSHVLHLPPPAPPTHPQFSQVLYISSPSSSVHTHIHGNQYRTYNTNQSIRFLISSSTLPRLFWTPCRCAHSASLHI
ncbi:hypothetical protein C8R43DRAFT_640772 [Mycena crocata]|nr:hypothetical protein C8R43DRAFT_640772 [Mycena crocata]